MLPVTKVARSQNAVNRTTAVPASAVIDLHRVFVESTWKNIPIGAAATLVAKAGFQTKACFVVTKKRDSERTFLLRYLRSTIVVLDPFLMVSIDN